MAKVFPYRHPDFVAEGRFAIVRDPEKNFFIVYMLTSDGCIGGEVEKLYLDDVTRFYYVRGVDLEKLGLDDALYALPRRKSKQ